PTHLFGHLIRVSSASFGRIIYAFSFARLSVLCWSQLKGILNFSWWNGFYRYRFNVAFGMPSRIHADNIQGHGSLYNQKSLKKGIIHTNTVNRTEIARDIKAIDSNCAIWLEFGTFERRHIKRTGFRTKLCGKGYFGSDGDFLVGRVVYIDRCAVDSP